MSIQSLFDPIVKLFPLCGSLFSYDFIGNLIQGVDFHISYLFHIHLTLSSKYCFIISSAFAISFWGVLCVFLIMP